MGTVYEQSDSECCEVNMKGYKKQVKVNPFTTYRDPKTGRWVVVKTELQDVKKKIVA